MSIIYYKTAKNSETGTKIQNLIDRAARSVIEINKFVKDLNCDPKKVIVSDRFIFRTGIKGLKFENEPDMKVWKNYKDFPGYYSPRMSCKEGKKLAEKMNSFEKVERDEIGEAIGLNDFFKMPGLNTAKNGDYFGFVIDNDWNHKMPVDCAEITGSEYDNL